MTCNTTKSPNTLEDARRLINDSTKPLRGGDLLIAAEFFHTDTIAEQWSRAKGQDTTRANTVRKAISAAAERKAKEEDIPYPTWRQNYDATRFVNGALSTMGQIFSKQHASPLPDDPTLDELALSIRKNHKNKYPGTEFYVKLHSAISEYSSEKEARSAVIEAFGYQNEMCAVQLITKAKKTAQKKDGGLHDYRAMPPPPPQPEAPRATSQSRHRLPSNFPPIGKSSAIVASGPLAAPGNQFAFVAPLAPGLKPASPPSVLLPPPTATIPPVIPSTEPAAATTTSSTTKRRRVSLPRAPAPPTSRSRKAPLQAPAHATLLLKKMREQPANFTLFELYITQLPTEHYGESEEDATLLLRLCEKTRLEETLFQAYGREAVCMYLARRVEEWVKTGAAAGTWYPYVYQCLIGAEEEMKRVNSQQA